MLAIRLQRTGRTGHSQFRLIVQDSRFSPKSGRVVEYLGSYNPHTKAVQVDKEAASKHLANGAQPSPRAAKLLKNEGVKLPSWVAKPTKQNAAIRNPDKLRRNRPAEAVAKSAESEPMATEQPEPEAAEPIAGTEATTAETPASDEKSDNNNPADEIAKSETAPEVAEAPSTQDQTEADKTTSGPKPANPSQPDKS